VCNRGGNRGDSAPVSPCLLQHDLAAMSHTDTAGHIDARTLPWPWRARQSPLLISTDIISMLEMMCIIHLQAAAFGRAVHIFLARLLGRKRHYGARLAAGL
jgi:hypothetical protein